MKITLKDKNGVILHTSKKYCKEDIEVSVDTQDLTVTPTTKEQKFIGLFENVTVGVTLDTSDATATAEDIAKDKTAYVNGAKITGTNENKTANDIKVKGNTLIINEANIEGGTLIL